MLTVRFEDHREAIKTLLAKKLLAAVDAAAVTLADGYKFSLQRTIAPPHSNAGQVPHAYFGWKPGGYGPVNADTTINNIPPEFSSVQQDYLSSYIEGGSAGEFGDSVAFVGFAPSHVGNRNENYLIFHDQNGRPWIRPVYDREKGAVSQAAKTAFEGTK